MRGHGWPLGAAALLSILLVVPASARKVAGFGSVSFPNSCSPKVQDRLDVAVAQLHAFAGSEDAFRAIARADPGCAVAWWGAAMATRGNPLAGGPGPGTVRAGQSYMTKAVAAHPATEREAGLVSALQVYYRDPAESHAARTVAYEAAMKRLAAAYPDDPEVQSFAALAILEAVDLTDLTFARQLEAGPILEKVWAAHPDHPGAPHYLIHAYDYPPLAARALEAARLYPGIAPASAHAQHMPSHIFSMLGLWRESIAANQSSAEVADPMLHGMHGAGVEAKRDSVDAHGMDFIAYARLQLGQDRAVAAALAGAAPSPERTLVAARYLLERGDWRAAAVMPVSRDAPLDAVTERFVRALGMIRSGRSVREARTETEALRALRLPVERADGSYWAGLVDVYAPAAEAWIAKFDGRPDEAAGLMRKAADADDAREKHILLENKLLPIRELEGELLLELGRPQDALAAFATSARSAPNRLRTFLGTARAAHALGGADVARDAYRAVLKLTATADPGRPEIGEAKRYLDEHL